MKQKTFAWTFAFFALLAVVLAAGTFDMSKYFDSTYSIEVTPKVHEELEVEYEDIYRQLNQEAQTIIKSCSFVEDKENCLKKSLNSITAFEASILDLEYSPDYEKVFHSFVGQFLEIQETTGRNCEKNITFDSYSDQNYHIVLEPGNTNISLKNSAGGLILLAPNIPKTYLTEINPCAESRVKINLFGDSVDFFLGKISSTYESPKGNLELLVNNGNILLGGNNLRESGFIVGSDGKVCFIEDIPERTSLFYYNLYLYSTIKEFVKQAAGPEANLLVVGAETLVKLFSLVPDDEEAMKEHLGNFGSLEFGFCTSLSQQNLVNLESVFEQCKEGYSFNIPGDLDIIDTASGLFSKEILGLLDEDLLTYLDFTEKLKQLRKPQCPTEKRFFALSAKYNDGKMLDYSDFHYKDIVINFSIYIE